MGVMKEKAEEAPVEEAAPQKSTKTSKKASVTSVAKEWLSGEGGWGSGRERDERTRAAGHDVEAVRAEFYRLRAEANS